MQTIATFAAHAPNICAIFDQLVNRRYLTPLTSKLKIDINFGIY